ncbi:hypothetical protein KKH3_15710 [Pectobacterium actinidiae]|nr:hypothetical protein KKH3_15710 [Pectobacterium actinidiae]
MLLRDWPYPLWLAIMSTSNISLRSRFYLFKLTLGSTGVFHL